MSADNYRMLSSGNAIAMTHNDMIRDRMREEMMRVSHEEMVRRLMFDPQIARQNIDRLAGMRMTTSNGSGTPTKTIVLRRSRRLLLCGM